MLGIGAYYFFKVQRAIRINILGGRSLNGWVTALSAQASDMSGWLLLGLPGAAYLRWITRRMDCNRITCWNLSKLEICGKKI